MNVPVSRHVDGFIDIEKLPEKPSRIKVWGLRKFRKEINLDPNRPVANARGSKPDEVDVNDLTTEEIRALAWVGDRRTMSFFAAYSNDPQTLAIIARMTEKPGLRDPDLIRGVLVENPAASPQTLNYLSTFVESENCEYIAEHPNTPDEALRRLLSYPEATLSYTRAIMRRQKVNIDIALDAVMLAREHEFDFTPIFKETLCRELEKPIGLIVSADAVRQIRAHTRPDILALTARAKKRTKNWDARTVAALDVLQDTESIDGETLCLLAEELVASKQSQARKGDPPEKGNENSAAQSI